MLITAHLAAPLAAVPLKTIEALNRTITIDDWYANQRQYSEEVLQDYIQPVDRDLILRSGFRCIKIRVEGESMADDGASLIKSVESLLSRSDTGERAYVLLQFLAAPPESVVKYLRRDRVIVQLGGPVSFEEWRRACPQLTLIKPGGDSKVVTYVPDPNVVYSFELVTPHLFKSQYDEKWDPNWGKLMYPPNAGQLRLTASQRPEPLRTSLISYATQPFGVDEWKFRLKDDRDWGRKVRRYIWLDDVGCSALADQASRTKYLTDIGTAANSLDIGWNLTSYTGLRAITKGESGNRSLRPEALAIFTSGQ